MPREPHPRASFTGPTLLMTCLAILGVEEAAAQEPATYRLRELWAVGGADAGPDHAFTGPFFVTAFGPNGQVAVLDQAVASVFVYDGANGDFVRRFAGRGEGPVRHRLVAATRVVEHRTGCLGVGDALRLRRLGSPGSERGHPGDRQSSTSDRGAHG